MGSTISRFIYGNFITKEAAGIGEPSGHESWRETATSICDGGPVFFGVEYDVDAGKFSHLAFNGPY
jgi:hypothetical protein